VYFEILETGDCITFILFRIILVEMPKVIIGFLLGKLDADSLLNKKVP
jgi:hypothetical protein